MSIENVEIQEFTSGNKIREQFKINNTNDLVLKKAIVEHVQGTADKHNLSDIVNDSNVNGDTLKEVAEFIYNTFLKHVNGTENRHKASYIDNDSTVYGSTVKTALEYLLKTLLEHAEGVSNRHKTSYINNDTNIVGDTLNDVLELLKINYTKHVNETADKHNAINVLFDSLDIAELTAKNVQNAIEQLNERFNNIIISGGDSNPEVVDGRLSVFWDIIFTTLKERLDYTEKKFGENYPENSIVTLEHNLGYIPLVTVIKSSSGAGKLPAGYKIDGARTTIFTKQKHISKNKFELIVSKDTTYSNAVVTKINDFEYVVNFDDTQNSLHIFLR